MNDLYLAILRKKGIKLTKQRLALFEVIERAAKPLTAEHLFDLLQEGGHRLNLSTIYRILSVFEAENLVRKATFEGLSGAYYESTSQDHSHRLICMTCHHMIELDDCPVHAYEEQVAKQYGYKIVKHHFEVYGICGQCLALEES